MFNLKTLLYHLPIGIVTLELAIAPGIASPTLSQSLFANRSIIQLAQSNPPPPPTNPDRSSAGGRRDPSNNGVNRTGSDVSFAPF
ncbi:MAG: hypothetical protein RMY16_24865 [Nostoc sp. DedQUE12b]|uniref:hypothetical protein n=1 Tax=Nostoc sp. DedQUE12b TaxID=3075398 RepID=UPI002AD47DAC|nr:hypothetical protein [Nostoc sp. DedQUE12b]MDZ8088758.1 hypothetical protein [Nostoc sp. DedQUE12b]